MPAPDSHTQATPTSSAQVCSRLLPLLFNYAPTPTPPPTQLTCSGPVCPSLCPASSVQNLAYLKSLTAAEDSPQITEGIGERAADVQCRLERPKDADYRDFFTLNTESLPACYGVITCTSLMRLRLTFLPLNPAQNRLHTAISFT